MSYSCPLAAGKNPFFTKIINQIKAFLYFILKYFKRDFLHFFNRLMTIYAFPSTKAYSVNVQYSTNISQK